MYRAKLQSEPHHRMAAEFINTDKDLTKQERRALYEAAEDIDVQLQGMGIAGGLAALTGGGIGLAADAAQDDDNNILVNPVTGALTLTGIGGYSGHHVGTKVGMHNKPVDTQSARIRTLRHGGIGSAAGAAIGGGAGLLLSLTGSFKDNEEPIYI